MWGIQVCEAKNPRIPSARDIGPKSPQALKSPVSHDGHRASSFSRRQSSENSFGLVAETV